MRDDRVMAGTLLRGALAALLVQGCLLPQEDPTLPDLPPKQNTPPELLEDTAFPARKDTLLRLSSLCAKKDRPFQIAVSDVDPSDTIESRWFVDDDRTFDTLPINGTSLPKSTVPARGVVRPSELFYTTGKLIISGSHKVTVVVADRRFKSVGIDVQLDVFDLPDGGTVSDTTTTRNYMWDVITDLSCD